MQRSSNLTLAVACLLWACSSADAPPTCGATGCPDQTTSTPEDASADDTPSTDASTAGDAAKDAQQVADTSDVGPALDSAGPDATSADGSQLDGSGPDSGDSGGDSGGDAGDSDGDADLALPDVPTTCAPASKPAGCCCDGDAVAEMTCTAGNWVCPKGTGYQTAEICGSWQTCGLPCSLPCPADAGASDAGAPDAGPADANAADAGASDPLCCGGGKACALGKVCVTDVCKDSKGLQAGQCWSAQDCSKGQPCEGADVCPCGAMCLLPDKPGSCKPPATTCTKIDPFGYGMCDMVLGVGWDGAKCVYVSGCGCQSDCDALFKTMDDCKASCGG